MLQAILIVNITVGMLTLHPDDGILVDLKNMLGYYKGFPEPFPIHRGEYLILV